MVSTLTDVARCADIIALCPQRRIFAPILAADICNLFVQIARSNPLEQANDLSRSKFWRCAHKQMCMIRHDLNCQYLKTILSGFLPTTLSISPRLARLKPFYDCGVSKRRWGGVIRFVGHRPILTKEGVFLHPLKLGGIRC